MVPMINATQFEDDESDEDNLRTVWTDRHNQRSMNIPTKTAAEGDVGSADGGGSTSPSTDDGGESTTTAILDVGQVVTLRSPRLNRFEEGASSSTAVTGELITVDTV